MNQYFQIVFASTHAQASPLLHLLHWCSHCICFWICFINVNQVLTWSSSICYLIHFIYWRSCRLSGDLFQKDIYLKHLTLSRRRFLSYRNDSINLLWKSMAWLLYDRDLRHERVKAYTCVYRTTYLCREDQN